MEIIFPSLDFALAPLDLCAKNGMNYQLLGTKTRLRLGELAQATSNFGMVTGYGADPVEARRIWQGYVEAGGNFIDTSNAYHSRGRAPGRPALLGAARGPSRLLCVPAVEPVWQVAVREVFAYHSQRYGTHWLRAEVQGRWPSGETLAHGLRAQQPRSFVPRTTDSDPAVRAAPNRLPR
jgi:hypothetical protein